MDTRPDYGAALKAFTRAAGRANLSAAAIATVSDSLAALKKSGAAPDSPRAGVRTMSAEEAAAYLRAEQLAYQDAPCACPRCQAAQVTNRSRRFVPNVLPTGDEDRAWCPPKRQVVAAGHWLHGVELQAWYTARAQFCTLTPPARLREIPLRMAKADLPESAAKKETA